MMADADRIEVERLLAEQDRVSADLRRRFLRAVAAAGDAVDWDEVARLVQAGRVEQAVSEVTAAASSRWASVGSAVANAAAEAAQSASMAVSRSERTYAQRSNRARQRVPGTAEFAFDRTNPRATEFLRRYEFDLIRELTAETRRAVGAVIEVGTTAGRNPRDVARDVRNMIGLTRRQARAVMNYRTALERGDSAALQRSLRDQRFDATVRRAARGERPLRAEQVDKMVGRYEQRYLKYRSEVIARTEAIRAVNAGNLEAWRQAVDTGAVRGGQVRRKWVYTHDARTRPEHRAIPGMNPDEGVGIDEPFQTPLGPLMFPGDPRGAAENTIQCRCTQVIRYSLTESEDKPKEAKPPREPKLRTSRAKKPAAVVAKPSLVADHAKGTSLAFKEEVDNAVALIPQHIREDLAAKGMRLKTGDFLTTLRPDLKGDTPRGWPPGATWDEAEGAFTPDQNTAFVTMFRKRRGEPESAVRTERAAGATLHELGHAVDWSGGPSNDARYSNDLDFFAAYEADVKEIGDMLKPRLGYFLQPGEAGRQEAFAELFANILGTTGGYNQKIDFFFPRSAAVIRKQLRL